MPSYRKLLQRLSAAFGDYLSRPLRAYAPAVEYSTRQLASALQPGDVLLVEGNLRISSLIKYITQSTWSHVALYVGPQPGAQTDDPPVLVEAEIGQGVILSSLSKYAGFHTRICRATGLLPADREKIVRHALGRVGHAYDLKNVVDLARHWLGRTSASKRAARQWMAFGSGEPTRVICSTLIAQAFQSVRYPILPTRRVVPVPCPHVDRDRGDDRIAEAWDAPHFSRFAPRDFDVSPYFTVVKPPPHDDFDYPRLRWAD